MKIFLKIFLLLPSLLLGQTVIYRSVQINKTSAIATPASITISGSSLTTSALPDCVGVGDMIQFDSTGLNLVINAIVAIHGRTSSTAYTVKRPNGGTPPQVTGATNASIFRAYVNFNLNESGDENDGISDLVENFDTGARNIVSNNEQWRFACYRGGLGSGMNFDTWTTGTSAANQNNYVVFYAPYLSSEVGVTQRHSGVYVGDNNHATVTIGGTSPAFTLSVGKVIVDGLVINANLLANITGIDLTGTGANTEYTVKNCIIKGFGAANGRIGFQIIATGSPSTYYIYNNIVYDWVGQGGSSDAGIQMNGANGTCYAYNNTLVDNRYGLRRVSGTMIGKNNLGYSNDTGSDFNDLSSGSDYNSSSDGSGNDFGANGRENQTFTFINEAGNNFLLAPTDAGARNFGVDLSADANLAFTTDINNTTRPIGTAWDMGAHEAASANRSRNVIIIGSTEKFLTLFLALVATGAIYKKRKGESCSTK